MHLSLSFVSNGKLGRPKSFQVLRVGQLLIAAAPGEFTTMAGRSNPGVNLLRGQMLFETFPKMHLFCKGRASLKCHSPAGVFERQWQALGRRSARWWWPGWQTRTRTTSPPGRSTRPRGLPLFLFLPSYFPGSMYIICCKRYFQ